jgi:hypothetical protein
MTVRIYRSTDTSAPVLSGQVGALAGVLDACLVNGYGSTVAAGWAIAFTGTNLRAYRAATGLRHYLALDDTGTTYGRMIGYEAMTAVSTGTGPFPTTAQLSGGNYWPKGAANSTARPWKMIADGKRFYFQVLANAGSDYYGLCTFGEFKSFYGADSYATMQCGGGSGVEYANFYRSTQASGPLRLPLSAGHYVPRIGAGTGTSVGASKGLLMFSSLVGSSFGAGGLTYPHTPDSGLWLSPVMIQTDASIIRGSMPGIWAGVHNTSSVTVPMAPP